MEILHQLGELFLEAVPTVIIVFLFYLFMRWAFFGPIQKAMAERSARIEGARAEAAKVEAEARQELDAYNEALKKARAQICAERPRDDAFPSGVLFPGHFVAARGAARAGARRRSFASRFTDWMDFPLAE